MTVGGLRTGMCSSPHDLSTIATCHWLSLNAPSPSRKNAHGDSNILQGPKSRHRHTACCVGEFVYIFCGKEGSFPCKDVWKFHTGSCTWEAVELQGASLPFLQGHTSVVYKKLVVIFGGTFCDGVGDVQLWTFDSSLSHVEEVRIKPGMTQPTCRRDHSAVVHNNTMFVYGGFVDSRGANEDLWAFNIEEREWRELRALSRAQPGCRYGHSAVVADNAMWLFGGLAGLSPKSDLWRYSFLLHQWKKVKGLGSPPCLSGHTASVVHHHMVVVGGKCQGKLINEVWCFSFDTNTWQQVNQLGSVLPCLSFHTCVAYCPTQPAAKKSKSCTSKSTAKRCKGFMSGISSNTCVREEKSSWQDQSSAEVQERILMDSAASEKNLVSRYDRPEDLDADSSSVTDASIHVSLKQTLIPPVSPLPASPSHRPFPWKGPGYSRLKDDVIHDSMPPKSDCPVLSVPSSESVSNKTSLQPLSLISDSQKALSESLKSVPDLIDLSDSPVLKVSALRNELLLEESDLIDDKSLDKLPVSYSSKNPFLPCQSLNEDTSVLSSDSFLLAGPQWDSWIGGPEAVGFSDWYQPHQHQHTGHRVDLNQVFPDSAAKYLVMGAHVHQDLKEKSPWVEQDVPYQSHYENKQQETPFDQIESVQQENLSSSSLLMNKELHEFSVCSQPTSGTDSSETQTSFIVSDEDVLLIQTEELQIENKVRQGTGLPGSVNVSGISYQKEQTSGREDVMGSSERGGEGYVCAEEEAVMDSAFLLVLGGRMEGQGSGHSEPVAVWKGIFM